MAAVLAMTLAAGCGDAGRVTIEGMVYSDHRVDVPCDEQAALPTRPEELSGIVLSFSDRSGKPLGEATTGPLEWEELDYGCRFLARYQAVLPGREAYGVDFDPPPPRDLDGSFYEGAEMLETQEISSAELQASGYQWSFEAEPAYVVP